MHCFVWVKIIWSKDSRAWDVGSTILWEYSVILLWIPSVNEIFLSEVFLFLYSLPFLELFFSNHFSFVNKPRCSYKILLICFFSLFAGKLKKVLEMVWAQQCAYLLMYVSRQLWYVHFYIVTCTYVHCIFLLDIILVSPKCQFLSKIAKFHLPVPMLSAPWTNDFWNDNNVTSWAACIHL